MVIPYTLLPVFLPFMVNKDDIVCELKIFVTSTSQLSWFSSNLTFLSAINYEYVFQIFIRHHLRTCPSHDLFRFETFCFVRRSSALSSLKVSPITSRHQCSNMLLLYCCMYVPVNWWHRRNLTSSKQQATVYPKTIWRLAVAPNERPCARHLLARKRADCSGRTGPSRVASPQGRLPAMWWLILQRTWAKSACTVSTCAMNAR